MADVKWVRIATDIFDNAKIKYLRLQPKGDTYFTLWIWLISRAGKCNAGGRIYITEGTSYSPALIASEIGAKPSVVSQGLELMEQLNMIEHAADSEILILGWEEHQNASGMDKIREQTRERVKRCRERNDRLALRRLDHGTHHTAHLYADRLHHRRDRCRCLPSVGQV